MVDISQQFRLSPILNHAPSHHQPKSNKHVCFAANLASIRYFEQDEREISVDSQEADQQQRTYRTIQTMNFSCADGILNNHNNNNNMVVQLKSLNLCADGSKLLGVVNVANLAFEKTVAVRFTTDEWETVSEVFAEYHHPSNDHDHQNLPPGYDEFAFTIDINFPGARTLYFCVRYCVNSQEFWDNNNTMNYHVNISPLTHHHRIRRADRSLPEPLPAKTIPTIHNNHLSWNVGTRASVKARPGSISWNLMSQPRTNKGADKSKEYEQLVIHNTLANRHSWNQSSSTTFEKLKLLPVSPQPILPCKGDYFTKPLAGDFHHLFLLGQ